MTKRINEDQLGGLMDPSNVSTYIQIGLAAVGAVAFFWNDVKGKIEKKKADAKAEEDAKRKIDVETKHFNKLASKMNQQDIEDMYDFIILTKSKDKKMKFLYNMIDDGRSMRDIMD